MVRTAEGWYRKIAIGSANEASMYERSEDRRKESDSVKSLLVQSQAAADCEWWFDMGIEATKTR